MTDVSLTSKVLGRKIQEFGAFKNVFWGIWGAVVRGIARNLLRRGQNRGVPQQGPEAEPRCRSGGEGMLITIAIMC